jgi:beta-lactamase regulating signal transducer with metallopeptidase domain
MNPDHLLRIVAALAGFGLKTALAFGVCLVFSWLVDSPNRRFMIWLAFLYGAAAYWIWLAKGVLAGGQLSACAPHASAQATTSTVSTWQIPGSWALPLGVALRVIGIAYLLVLSYILLTHIKRQRHLKWVLSFTTKPPVEIAETFQPLAESLHVGRSRLLVLSGVTSPATFGWIRPTILLPALCLEQDPSELEDILRHELQHARRLDFFWNGFAVVCRALLFFHPAAWYAVRKVQFDRELACDLAVVSHSPGRRATYAECLVRFARLTLSEDPKTWGIDFAASSEHLKARVHSILAGSRKPSGWLTSLRIGCGVTLLAGSLGIAPSLAVLLSYTQQQMSQPLTSEPRPSHSGMDTEARATRKVRPLSFPAPRNKDAAVANLGQPEGIQPPTHSPPDSTTEGQSSTQSGSGPQLLHRRSPATGRSFGPDSNGAKQQTVALTDPDAPGQVSKTGDQNRKQTLQQSATAAVGIYKRLAEVDRH